MSEPDGGIPHFCHWPDCPVMVPPKLWGCKGHWFSLPKHLRDRIWATYKPGQEYTKSPSQAYLYAAEDVQQWISQYLSKSHENMRLQP
jgi:hypothetical protein